MNQHLWEFKSSRSIRLYNFTFIFYKEARLRLTDYMYLQYYIVILHHILSIILKKENFYMPANFNFFKYVNKGINFSSSLPLLFAACQEAIMRTNDSTY